MAERILITGGAGFIGSNLIRLLIDDYKIICLDRLSYAGNPRNLTGLTDTMYLAPGYPEPKRDGGLRINALKEIPDEGFVFIIGAVNDFEVVSNLLDHVDGIIHLAAETHIDRSFIDPGSFIKNDFLGTYSLLEAIRMKKKPLRLVHVSTDEVYGATPKGEFFNEADPINPTNPYSVSKAAADRLVVTYQKTYGIEALVVRPANNYGPRQHVEKFIPFLTTSGFQNLPLFIYGDGSNIRSWIFVDDCCHAIKLVFDKGKIGEVYNIPGHTEMENIKIAEILCELMKIDRSKIEFIGDRPAHDKRYALDGSKLRDHIGFKPSTPLKDGLANTVSWYGENGDWWQELWDDEFREFVREWYGGLGASIFKKS